MPDKSSCRDTWFFLQDLPTAMVFAILLRKDDPDADSGRIGVS